ncbi:mechanosensitive channel MscK [Serpens gallinarum]|uniref:Mechanosensitive channel MscK n=1 Tax=Serpens gallinarum TaxID=2763075 RepID=A0ABR8TJG6_9PSED|nr:mechanosensitive channel MscK [Serpens gallinarum]MBD7975917.1 mechanosensitive channel MscK [Serpens gallinarum]
MLVFRFLCLTFLFVLSGVLLAADPPSREAVEASLAALADRKLPEAEQLRVQQTLEQTLAQLDQQQELQQRLEALQQQLDVAPQQINEARQALEELQLHPAKNPLTQYADTDMVELELILTDRSQQLTDWQKQLTAANSLIISAQTRPERAQTEISANQNRILQLQTALKDDKLEGKTLIPEQRDLLNAELVTLELRNELRRQELAGNNPLLDLGTSRRELLTEQVTRLENELEGLQTLINERRLAQSAETREEVSREARSAGPGSLLARETATNLKLTDYLLRVTDRLNEVTQANLRTKQRLDTLTQSEQALEEQIDVLRGSLLLSQILLEQKRRLPQVKTDTRLADDIADIRLYQFELNQNREQLNNPQQFVATLLEKEPGADSESMRASLLELAKSRSELLDRLARELNALLGEAISLQLNQTQLNTLASQLSKTLEEQLFWIPSNPPLSLVWWARAPERLAAQIATLPWLDTVKDLGRGLMARPWVFLPLLLSALLFFKRSLFRRKLHALHQDIGHFPRDSQRHTPLALLFNLLQALPGTMLLALCGYALQIDARGQNTHLGAALFAMAGAWLVIYTSYRILTPGGVAERHFGWARAQISFLYRNVRWLGVVVLVLVGVVTFAEDQPTVLTEDVLGVLLLLCSFGVLAWLLGRLMFSGPHSDQASPFRKLIGALLTLLPLGMMVALFAGYYYTTLKLSGRLIDTLYALLIWILLEAMLVRGLSLAARRLAWQRLQAKRDAAQQETPDGATVAVEEPELAIEDVNEQSLRLIRLGLLAGLVAVLWWVWSDMLTVFTYLDTITLYQFTSGTGATASLVPISMLDVLGALLIVAITVILARNLPGLLEVLILSRLKLAQGSAYATTTLLSYAILGFGIVTTLSTLGVSWDKLQWLVAALSVGIGFGMQEIFANFISGLIILFERPVRIGDLVTIGNVTGTVKRIHIRATHIIDGDRKEVIVPNKTFVTSQLINWTLTDTITRIVLSFGVNRGADLSRVRELLLQAAQQNPRVMRDPEPVVQMTTYATSGLTHELKFYVKELVDRGLATDEINRRVDQLFIENGINVVGRPQMEVFMVNREGKEQAVEPAKSETP